MSALQPIRDLLDPQGKKQREDAAKKLQAAAAERRLDLRWLMSDARGRRIVRRELARAGLFGDVLKGDPRATEHAAVLRDHALALFNELLAVTPEEALALFKVDPVFQMHQANAKTKNAPDA